MYSVNLMAIVVQLRGVPSALVIRVSMPMGKGTAAGPDCSCGLVERHLNNVEMRVRVLPIALVKVRQRL